MSPSQPMQPPQPTLRPVLKALLVLTVLAGVVGMHGLSAMSPLPADHHEPRVSQAAHQPQPSPVTEERLRHGDGNPGAPHGSHADQMCASGAPPGPVTAPALAITVPNGIDTAVRPLAPPCSEPAAERAPPSLAELQLLRI